MLSDPDNGQSILLTALPSLLNTSSPPSPLLLVGTRGPDTENLKEMAQDDEVLRSLLVTFEAFFNYFCYILLLLPFILLPRMALPFLELPRAPFLKCPGLLSGS